MTEDIGTAESEVQETEETGGHGISISDNLVILLLIAFALMIGAWWLVNLYMGRWI